MKNALKGALFSGLVFPGLGQVILKHYKRGVVIMLTSSASLLIIITKAVQKAFAILEKMELDSGTIDMNMIVNAAKQSSRISGDSIFTLALLLFVFCWILGTVDAYRIGRIKDNISL
jgi:hypothetical protein